MNNTSVKVYAGTPHDIMNRIMGDISDALDAAGISPTGLHLLAMAALIGKEWSDSQARKDEPSRAMPSFSAFLSIFVKSATGTAWTEDEKIVFTEDFMRIIRSLGGSVAPPGTPPPFMVPSDGLVH